MVQIVFIIQYSFAASHYNLLSPQCLWTVKIQCLEKLRIETFSTFEARAGEINVYEFSACSYLIASEASVVQFMDLQHTTA